MTNGIHHVTAIGGAARRNVDFYTRVLGLRLVKRTVNFDDPGTYHLYYGDENGTPGTILTFFPWEHVTPGRLGAGETLETSFRVPAGALPVWTRMFQDRGVACEPLERRFGQSVVRFRDPDGMRLALVGVEGIDGDPAWSAGEIAADHAIRGFHGVTLLVNDPEPTAAILSDVMGFAPGGTDGTLRRFTTDAPLGGVVDLRGTDLPRGRQGGGSVHHVAFRATDDAAQAAMVRKLAENHGLGATEQKDRNYFRSVYLREPNGIIFEIATDAPGFAVDEAPEALGTALKLPAGLEARRARIEAVLPALSA